MFVFKAAVVGAGTMGGEIAQAIAAAGIPVVLKDVDQELVDVGLQKARKVTEGQVARLVKKGKITEEQGRAQVEEVVGRITGTTTYDGFGDVDFVIEAVPERMEIKQAVFAELDAVTPGHAILASNTSVAVDHRDRRRDAAPREGRRLPLLLPGVGHAADRDRHRRRHRRRDASAPRSTSPRRSASSRSPAPRSPASSSTGSSTRRCRRSGAPRRRAGCRSRRSTRPSRRPRRRRWGRSSSSTCSASTPCCTSPSTSPSSTSDRFYVHQGMQRLVGEGKLGAKTGGSGFYENGEPQIDGRRRPAGRPAATAWR